MSAVLFERTFGYDLVCGLTCVQQKWHLDVSIHNGSNFLVINYDYSGVRKQNEELTVVQYSATIVVLLFTLK